MPRRLTSMRSATSSTPESRTNPDPHRPGAFLCKLRLYAAFMALALAGCAGTLPPLGERPPSVTWVGSADGPMASIAGRVGIADDSSAAWPLPQAAIALDARLAAIGAATRSIDVQTYLLADDG